MNLIGDYIFEHLDIYSDGFEYHKSSEEYIRIFFIDKNGRWCVLTESTWNSVGDSITFMVFKKYVPRHELKDDDRLLKHRYDIEIKRDIPEYPSNYYEEQRNLLRAFISLSNKLHDKDYQEKKGVIFEENDDSDITIEEVINNTLIQFSNNVQDYHKQLL